MWSLLFWSSPARIERLQALVAADLSASQIATELSREFDQFIGRKGVMGKIRRMGLALHGQPRSNPPDVSPSVPRKMVGNAPQSPVFIALRRAAVLRDVELTTVESIDPALHRDLLSLEDGACHWPVGDAMFCGAPVVAWHKSYCPIHTETSKKPARERLVTSAIPVHRKGGRWS